MEYLLKVQDAVDLGLEEAILYSYMDNDLTISPNENEVIDGMILVELENHVLELYSMLFPFWTQTDIARILVSLERQELVCFSRKEEE
ncbi:MAG: hypothetical protein KJO69_02270 [Gammaproteobacteria bacterium]|nr:hypothetical protein [Gammaproteobacteria bacterium]